MTLADCDRGVADARQSGVDAASRDHLDGDRRAEDDVADDTIELFDEDVLDTEENRQYNEARLVAYLDGYRATMAELRPGLAPFAPEEP